MTNWLEISKYNLFHNITTLSNLLGKQNISWVLKSNAYGHGLKEVYQILSEHNPSMISVNDVLEASALRQLGYKKRLLILGPITEKNFKKALAKKAEITIGSPELLTKWLQSKHQPSIHLKIDTGLGRQGIHPEQLPYITTKQLYVQKKQLLGIMTHFANVEDVAQQDYALRQLQLFKQAQSYLNQAGYDLPAHSAASAASLLITQSRLSFCRIGVSLYGYWPSALTKLAYSKQACSDLRLKPILTWKTQLAAVRFVAKGSYISYGCSYQTKQNLTIGILPVGYYEGYPRSASNKKAYVLYKGKRCTILGRICMNMMVIDITTVPNASVNDVVVLIGKQASKKISVEQLSVWAESTPREITARLNPNIKKKVV